MTFESTMVTCTSYVLLGAYSAPKKLRNTGCMFPALPQLRCGARLTSILF